VFAWAGDPGLTSCRPLLACRWVCWDVQGGGACRVCCTARFAVPAGVSWARCMQVCRVCCMPGLPGSAVLSKVYMQAVPCMRQPAATFRRQYMTASSMLWFQAVLLGGKGLRACILQPHHPVLVMRDCATAQVHTYICRCELPWELDVCCVVVSHMVGCALAVLRRMRHVVLASIFRFCECLCVVVWSLE
jgi:hypothetical protein